MTVQWQNGLMQRLVLDAPVVAITFTDPQPQQHCILLLQQGIGGSTITWPANVKFPVGAAPNLSAGVGAVDAILLAFDGTNYYVLAQPTGLA